MKTILVTGGSGYIGSHTSLSLLLSGFRVIILDSNINSHQNSLKRIMKIGNDKYLDFEERLFFAKGDIRDERLLDNIFKKANLKGINIDAVIHFAGLKSVKESISNPISYWDNNVKGSINLFKAMANNNCNIIVFSSSATVYGKQPISPIDENSSLNPINPYGETKVAVEKILENIFKGYRKKWGIINLRYFNPIGSHETGLIGENPLNYPNNIFPLICKVALKEIKKFSIFGNDWPTNDGTCIRDYIHVMDLAEAHLSSLNYLFRNDNEFHNLNIGTGKGTSVLELINIFEESNKCNINYEFTDRRVGDTAIVVADNKLALSILDWKPKRNIKSMCKDGWKSVQILKDYELNNNFANEKIQILN